MFTWIIVVLIDHSTNNQIFELNLETDAKLHVQFLIRAGILKLAWSYTLDYENNANPQLERKYIIQKWKNLSIVDTDENEVILDKANMLLGYGIKTKDALHIACAINMKCDVFLTTDDGIKKKASYIQDVKVLNPIELINMI